MPRFDYDEIQLISFYAADTLEETLRNIREMADYITDEEPELAELTASVLFKLGRMTEGQYRELNEKVIPDAFLDLPVHPEAEA